MNKQLIDLTQLLSEETQVYPGKTPFKKITCCFYENGYRLDDIQLSTGIGTHIDAPLHFYPDGLSVDQLPLNSFFSKACILNITDRTLKNPDYVISADDIKKWEKQYHMVPKNSLFLAYTGWSLLWGNKKFLGLDKQGVCHFPGFSQSAAELLVEREVCGVGIDTLSIDPGTSADYPAHKVLLSKNIFILENLAGLNQLPPFGSKVYTFPMNIKDVPEAPVRVIAEICHENN